MLDSRRGFLGRGLLAGAAAVVQPLEALAEAARRYGRAPATDGYGPLAPVADQVTGLPLVQLPAGFRYRSMGWTGDPLEGGLTTPPAHDGMAAFAAADGLVTLVRNHERVAGPAFAATGVYDPAAGGGTTLLSFDPRSERVVRAWAGLAGTVRNCAGGPTPWGTWLTCEESVLGPLVDAALTRAHGYVFEVPLNGTPSAEPLAAMGRFVHEAVAVDPSSGIVYQTEDAEAAGLYRFVPATPGRLARGGRLQMLAARGRPRADLRTGQRVGVVLGIYWVDIERPDDAHDGDLSVGGGLHRQGRAAGGATFARLEGAWHADGRIFITSTNGGEARMGQVWELAPGREELRLVYQSPGAHELNMPDNLVVSPRGGLVICEDGTANPCLHVLTRDGRIARFARNNVVLAGERNGLSGDFRASEMAGATFSPDGRWLFVNVQTPGVTLAITGPWERGPA